MPVDPTLALSSEMGLPSDPHVPSQLAGLVFKPQPVARKRDPIQRSSVSRKDAGVELALPWSSAAKRLVHDLIGPRRIDVAAEGRLILVRHGEHRQQTLEGLEIPNVHGCGDRLLHQMIAWDESRVGRAHRRSAFVPFSTLLCKPT